MLRNTLNQALLHTSAKLLLWLLCLTPLASLVGQLLLNALGPNPAEALIRSTGDWALRALCVALAVTPLRLFSGLTGLARMRRLLGLFAFFMRCYMRSATLGWIWSGNGQASGATYCSVPLFWRAC